MLFPHQSQLNPKVCYPRWPSEVLKHFGSPALRTFTHVLHSCRLYLPKSISKFLENKNYILHVPCLLRNATVMTGPQVTTDFPSELSDLIQNGALHQHPPRSAPSQPMILGSFWCPLSLIPHMWSISKSCRSNLKNKTRIQPLITSTPTTLTQASVTHCPHITIAFLLLSLLQPLLHKTRVILSKLRQIITPLCSKLSNLLQSHTVKQKFCAMVYKTLPSVAPRFLWSHCWPPRASTQSVLQMHWPPCYSLCTETHSHLSLRALRPAIPAWNAVL